MIYSLRERMAPSLEMMWFGSSHVSEGACVRLEGLVVFGTTDFAIVLTGLQPCGFTHLSARNTLRA